MTPRQKKFKWIPVFDRQQDDVVERRTPFEVQCGTSGGCLVITKHMGEAEARRQMRAWQERGFTPKLISKQPVGQAA